MPIYKLMEEINILGKVILKQTEHKGGIEEFRPPMPRNYFLRDMHEKFAARLQSRMGLEQLVQFRPFDRIETAQLLECDGLCLRL